MWKLPTKWKMLTTWWPWAHSPQASWSLRTDNVNPCDTTLLPHHQWVRELCMSWSHSLRPHLPHLAFKNVWPNTSGSSGLLGQKPPVSSYGPAINLSLLQTLTFQFVWPHCALGTWTCANTIKMYLQTSTLSWIKSISAKMDKMECAEGIVCVPVCVCGGGEAGCARLVEMS